jgi:hypothetical protein
MEQKHWDLGGAIIEWYERDGERYLAVNVDGKTNKRTAIARDSVENSFMASGKVKSTHSGSRL